MLTRPHRSLLDCADAFSYHSAGPGYNYLRTRFTLAKTTSPLSCQLAGIRLAWRFMRRAGTLGDAGRRKYHAIEKERLEKARADGSLQEELLPHVTPWDPPPKEKIFGGFPIGAGGHGAGGVYRGF